MATASPRRLRQRMAGVRTTITITRSLKTVASFQLGRTRARLAPAREFHRRLLATWWLGSETGRAQALLPTAPLLGTAVPPGVMGNPAALAPGPPGPPAAVTGNPLYLVLTSERGLAGSYNADVLREVWALRRREPGAGLVVLGQKGRDGLRARGVEPRLALSFPDQPGAGLARYLATELEQAWHKHSSPSFVVYTRFISGLRREVVTAPVLPPPAPLPAEMGAANVIWEPGEADSLRALAAVLAAATVYLALAEARASELAARLLAMDQATEQAEDVLEELVHAYHRARRERITRELVAATGRGVNAP